jgi:hypothetical protein
MRGKPPKEIQKRREESRPKKLQPAPVEAKWDWKYWAAFGITLAGALLGAIALRAKPTASLEPPLDPNDVLTTRVVISNDGMLDLENVTIASVEEDVLFGSTGHVNRSTKSLGEKYSPPAETLEIGEKETVEFRKLVTSSDPIISADIGLVVTFTPQYLPRFRRTRAFRFKTVRQADGHLRLEEQPQGELLSDYQHLIAIEDADFKRFGKSSTH